MFIQGHMCIERGFLIVFQLFYTLEKRGGYIWRKKSWAIIREMAPVMLSAAKNPRVPGGTCRRVWILRCAQHDRRWDSMKTDTAAGTLVPLRTCLRRSSRPFARFVRVGNERTTQAPLQSCRGITRKNHQHVGGAGPRSVFSVPLPSANFVMSQLPLGSFGFFCSVSVNE